MAVEPNLGSGAKMTVDVLTGTSQETAVFFEAEGRTLFGILTRPTAAAARPLAIVLQAGGTVSTDRNRVGVRLCRHLADLGFHALRFDYHGVGESDGHGARFRLDEPFRADLLGAVAWASGHELDRVVLIGTCFGARTALASAGDIDGLDGVVLMAAPVRDYEMGERVATGLAAGSDIPQHARQLLDGRVIRGMRDPGKRRKYARLAKSAVVGFASQARRRDALNDGVSPLFVAPLAGLVRRSIPTLFVYGSDDALWREFQQARAASELGDVLDAASGTVDVMTLAGEVHGFKSVAVQDAVIDGVGRWLDRLPPREAASSR